MTKSKSKLYDVVIAGAGPVGLFLAHELSLRQISVLILERTSQQDSPWKSGPLGLRGLNIQSIEAFYRRGFLGQLFNLDERPKWQPGKKPGFQFGGHFAGIAINANQFDLQRWKYRLPGPALGPGPTTMDQVEKVLTARVESLGVKILRGRSVRSIAQDETGVTVVTGGDHSESFRGKWLVGCDGGRSVVRKEAGFEFVGTDAQFTGYATHIEIEGREKLKPGFNVSETGMYINVVQNGAFHLLEFDGANFDRAGDITLEHLQRVLDRAIGRTDVKITKVHLASSYTDRSMQATSYRKNRVLLAGDAAHIHSPLGAQGLNVGLGDAMNLGWKLASIVQRDEDQGGDAGDMQGLALLDTYENERHPVAAWVLDWTRSQVTALKPDAFGRATRALMEDLIKTDDGANLFIDRVWGLSQRYTLGEESRHAHPLVGSSAPDFEFGDGSRLGSKLEEGRGILLDFGKISELESVVDGKYDGKVDYLCMEAKERCGLSALLIRPDGIVAWVVEDDVKHDIDGLKAALVEWFK
jgi:2-polyprenyl-6-methoxyphenol hydroxylase-like FAD-dependent oxidoreductase